MGKEQQISTESIESIETFEKTILEAIDRVSSLEDLNKVRVSVLGRKGSVTMLTKSLGRLLLKERKEQGKLYNSLRRKIDEAINRVKVRLDSSFLEGELATENFDMSLPSRRPGCGVVHPLSQALFEIVSSLHHMGFSIAQGPDIESDFNNFSALNMPPNHPARQEQDTFYMSSCLSSEPRVLRTHTSPVQVRAMLNQKPPIRVMAFGRVYRSDYDRTHTPCFYQVEGLFIDKGVHMGHLRQCLVELCSRVFGRDSLLMRFRPSFFPFTCPSAEMDVAFHSREQAHKFSSKNSSPRWLEILGCGMVHPKVLENCGINHDVYKGFAFGAGVERIAMLKYGIQDSRQFYEGDIRWIIHYGVSPFSAFL